LRNPKALEYNSPAVSINLPIMTGASVLPEPVHTLNWGHTRQTQQLRLKVENCCSYFCVRGNDFRGPRDLLVLGTELALKYKAQCRVHSSTDTLLVI